MKAATGATPLKALDAIVFDSETTGLDTKVARIVQMAAIGVSGGAIIEDDRYESLVDPRMAIPSSSTAIHGISDSMVRDAPVFAVALGHLEAYRSERPIIGYSIGFDLAIMAKEASRTGLTWRRPRSLCVRTLAAFANPNLPDHALETIATWLGVEIVGRHSAIGDARAAAAIFIALLPKLADQGVRTLAEAERASLGLNEQMTSHDRAGWTRPVMEPGDHPSLAAVDPYAYRHRVGQIASAELVIVAGDQRVDFAMTLMAERKISSVLVSPEGKPGGTVQEYGIVTERDMLRLVVTHGAAALEMPIDAIATRPLISVAEESFVYRAIGRMERQQIRHLAVRNHEDRLTGIISARDLLKLRGSAAIRLDDAIEAANNAADIAKAWAMLPGVTNRLLAEDIDPRILAGIVSEELRIVTRRAAVLAEAEMLEEGLGAPPTPYAFLVLGSGGRGESLLAADQDNAIVYQQGEPGGPEDEWFAELGERVAKTLDTAGIVYCKGGVMAKNPQWRGSLAAWHRRVAHWIGRSEPEDLLNVDIFFDMRAVHGSQPLAARLLDDALTSAHEHRPFAKLLGDQLGEFTPVFGMFGRLKSIDGRIDLKKHGLFPIVTLARALAIRHDIRHRRTELRLEGLIARGIGSEEQLTALLDAHRFILGLMLAQQSRDLADGIPVSNKVVVDRLTPSQAARLKAALKLVESVPNIFRGLVTAQPR
ncbi:DUF294 nucleotidyltransferase-like domain-containing protein [Rhizobium sp. EC-SD404]|uniref:DUF294 nucleotidyltransferase-like domain-containing protein n=1 Tax=Rhizobium sp. EC-SD404 TaxID=2038389 RepID=UPI001258CDB0|nr:DUF294 nucleotidyltransferase-like domain-containing protein [Rhizobium sp. EC-SD404]VVT29685.1 CBS domain-containing protein [Rhizobium sp. EC-SD404]